MKKSEIYKLAQVAVLKCSCISTEGTLEILRELMEKEDTAKFVEKREAEEF